MTKSHELGRRASKLELESTEQTLLFHLAEAQRLFESADDDLLRLAAEVTSRVERVVKHVESAQHVNELGELQSSAPRFDQLCAVRQERLSTVKRALHLARSLGVEVNDEEVF